jgi:hypothetical protein
MVYATSIMLPIYMPGDLRNPIIGEAGKKEAPHRGEAGRDGRICARGEGLKPRPARQRPPDMEGSRRAAIPFAQRCCVQHLRRGSQRLGLIHGELLFGRH